MSDLTVAETTQTRASSTVAEPKESPSAPRVSGDRVTVLRINPVDGLDHFLKAVEGQPRQGRLKCNNGRLVLVSPGLRHEKSDVRIGMMLNAVFAVLRIPSQACASTLYRLKTEGQVDRGVEPDLSYYIQNFEHVRGLKEMDLNLVPPPDLAIEVVDTHSAKTAIGVCLELHVPELWVYEVRSDTLTIRTLVQDATGTFQYLETDRSIVLPFLSLEEIAPWGAFTDESDMDFDRRARVWAETVLLPRYQAGGNGE